MQQSVSNSSETEYFRLFDSQRLAYPREDAVLRFLREGWFEYGEMAAFARMLRPGDQFIDIGAHCGLYSAIASKVMGPDANIVAVEPNNGVHSCLVANVKPTWVVDTYPETLSGRGIIRAAVGDRDGEAELRVSDSEHSAYGSIVPSLNAPSSDKGASEQSTFTVPVIMLQPLLEKVASNGLVFVKLDVEGLEFDLLQPAADYLKAQDNIHFQIEFDENNASVAGHDTAELAAFVLGLGFEFHAFDTSNQTLVPFSGKFPVWNTNLIATKRPDILAKRLAEADAEIMDMTNDLLGTGEVCHQAYLMREEAGRFRNELVMTAKTVRKMRATLESRPLKASEARKFHRKLEQADNRNLVELVHEALGQLSGAAQSVATLLQGADDDLHLMKADLEAANQMKTGLITMIEVVTKLQNELASSPLEPSELEALHDPAGSDNEALLTAAARDALDRLSETVHNLAGQLNEASRELEEARPMKAKLSSIAQTAMNLRTRIEGSPAEENENQQLTAKQEEGDYQALAISAQHNLERLGGAALSTSQDLDNTRQELMALHGLKPEMAGIIGSIGALQATLSNKTGDAIDSSALNDTIAETELHHLVAMARDSLASLGEGARDFGDQMRELSANQSNMRTSFQEYDRDSISFDDGLTLIKARLTEDQRRINSLQVNVDVLSSQLDTVQDKLDKSITKRVESEALVSAQNDTMVGIDRDIGSARDIIASMLFANDRPTAVNIVNLHSIKTDLNQIHDKIAELSAEAISYPEHKKSQIEYDRDLEMLRRKLHNLRTQFVAIHSMINDLERSRWLSLGNHLGVTAAERVKTMAKYVEQLNTEAEDLASGSGEESSDQNQVS